MRAVVGLLRWPESEGIVLESREHTSHVVLPFSQPSSSYRSVISYCFVIGEEDFVSPFLWRLSKIRQQCQLVCSFCPVKHVNLTVMTGLNMIRSLQQGFVKLTWANKRLAIPIIPCHSRVPVAVRQTYWPLSPFSLRSKDGCCKAVRNYTIC